MPSLRSERIEPSVTLSGRANSTTAMHRVPERSPARGRALGLELLRIEQILRAPARSFEQDELLAAHHQDGRARNGVGDSCSPCFGEVTAQHPLHQIDARRRQADPDHVERLCDREPLYHASAKVISRASSRRSPGEAEPPCPSRSLPELQLVVDALHARYCAGQRHQL